VRVASIWAGSNFGAIAIPRIGQEVIVQWLDGNPDRPIITGSVYNQDHMPPWSLPGAQRQTGILSRSTKGGGYDNANAFRFDDTKGDEEVWLHAEKDQRIEVENDETHWVGRDRSKTIDRDETVLVKRDRTETVDHDETITVHNNRTERVDHDEKISIGDNRTEDVGKNETISIGMNQSISIGASRSKTVAKNESDSIGRSWSVNVGKFKTETIGMAYMQNVGLGRMENVGAAYNLNVGGLMATIVGAQRSDATAMNHGVKVGMTYSLDAGEVIELRCGKSVLRMDSAGKVTIQGTEFLFDASGPVQINGKDIDLN
jgi:type VI secretion system secreted protein VgrG